jgi:glycolate oxidase iron-sulfur subunit
MTENLTTPHFRTLLDQCIHCGMCLQNCPTYVATGKEADSPRGRIQLMRAASEGHIPIDGAFREHLDLCLGCLSCQTACPSGVKYGALIDIVHATLAETREPGRIEKFVRWLGMHQLMPHLNRLRFVAKIFRLYQLVGLQWVVRTLNVLPKNLKAMEAILPPLPASHYDYSRPAPALGQKRGTVAFFYGCLQDAFLGDVNRATIRVLQRNGYEVHFPQLQTCCGAAHAHTGDQAGARALARKNIDAFMHGEYDAIINNAGGCGAMLKEYARLLADDPQYADPAKKFASQVQDISEFLAAHLKCPPRGIVHARVTYSDSCHLRNAQKIVKQPRELLKAIPGIELVEMQAPDRCCGSAGVYNLMHVDMANDVLDLRMQDIAATNADIVVTTNTGCHMQLIYGVRKAKLASRMRVKHLVELLDESYAKE